MADLKAPERNPVIGRLADILLSGKESANTYEMKDFKTATTKLHTDYGGTNPNEEWLQWVINAPEDDPNYFTEAINYLK